MSTQITPKLTLENIAQRKKKLQGEIQVQKKAMTVTVRNIFSPLPPANNKTNAIMRSFNTGMAVFDGVMLGIKLMRKIRKYFRNMK